jgi:hypothetical protein
MPEIPCITQAMASGKPAYLCLRFLNEWENKNDEAMRMRRTV